MFPKGTPVEVEWLCKRARDGGIKRPKDFVRAEYICKDLSGDDMHMLLFHFEERKAEEWEMYEVEFHPIIEEVLNVSDFV
jgi:hypothetical protein